MPLQRNQTHQLAWFFEYDKVTYVDGTETTRATTHKDKYGSWLIDSTNNGGYVTFQQTISTSTGTGTASLLVGPHPGSNSGFMDGDLPGKPAGYMWNFSTGLVFGFNEITVQVPTGFLNISVPVKINVGTNVVDGHVIENMPMNNVPLYNPLTGSLLKQVPVYGHKVTFQIRN